MPISDNTLLRFWKHVNENGPTQPRMDTPCWEWVGFRTPTGYGKFGITANVQLLAHRFSWTVVHGPPGDALVLHACDNRACMRVDHLRLGTSQDNMDDMHTRGRGRSLRGVDHPDAKLTEADVIAIRAARGVEFQRVTAARFGVTQVNVGMIQRRRSWKHVP